MIVCVPAVKKRRKRASEMEGERESMMCEIRGQKCRDDVGSNDLGHTP